MEPSAVCCVLFGFLFLLQRESGHGAVSTWLGLTQLGLAGLVVLLLLLLAHLRFCLITHITVPQQLYTYFPLPPLFAAPFCGLLVMSERECLWLQLYWQSCSCSTVNASVVHFRFAACVPVSTSSAVCRGLCALPGLSSGQHVQEAMLEPAECGVTTKSQLNRTPC